jgi:hypothetical protein
LWKGRKELLLVLQLYVTTASLSFNAQLNMIGNYTFGATCSRYLVPVCASNKIDDLGLLEILLAKEQFDTLCIVWAT